MGLVDARHTVLADPGEILDDDWVGPGGPGAKGYGQSMGDGWRSAADRLIWSRVKKQQLAEHSPAATMQH